jgi:hypothetical protein
VISVCRLEKPKQQLSQTFAETSSESRQVKNAKLVRLPACDARRPDAVLPTARVTLYDNVSSGKPYSKYEEYWWLSLYQIRLRAFSINIESIMMYCCGEPMW